VSRGFISPAVLVALALSAGSAATAWWVTRLYYREAAAEAAQDAREQVEAANRRADGAAGAYEAWKAAQRPAIANNERRLDHALETARQWADTPLPDGVRDELAAADAIATAGQPEAAVPAVPAAAEADERRPGP